MRNNFCLHSLAPSGSLPLFAAAAAAMNNQWIVTLVMLAIAFLVHLISQKCQRKENVSLVVLVLSARYNFAQRRAIRDTWMKESVSDPAARILFVVGDTDCPIPSFKRLSPFSCHEEELVHNFASKFASHTVAGWSPTCLPVASGFSFEVSSKELFCFTVLISRQG